MNIFVTDEIPYESSRVLPDKHIVKMPLETCQMLSIVCSDKWGHGFGTLPKSNGEPYKTDKGAFRNHPSTAWANKTLENANWLLAHGFGLCEEYCSLWKRAYLSQYSSRSIQDHARSKMAKSHTPFSRAMPEEFKYDDSIDTITAYKMYIASKPWVKDNYLRLPHRNLNGYELHSKSK